MASSFARRPVTLRRAALASLLVLLAGAVPTGACAAGNATESGQPTSSGNGFNFADGSSGAGGGDLIDSACANSTDEAKNVPLDLYIMFDKSGSMAGPKWVQSTAALQGFFESPTNAGIGIALRFFPDDKCDGTQCSVSACSTPKVPVGYLTNLSAPTDAHEQLLLDSFIGVVPSGGTPLSAALDGAIAWGNASIVSNPGHKAVIVLVTDGEPTDCNKNGADLVKAAKAAHDQSGIVTFAVGLEGASAALLDQIAVAGGTEKSFIVGTDKAQEQLVAALEAIRDKQVACDYAIPASTTGEAVDKSKVNVIYYPGDGSGKHVLGQVSTVLDCADKAAWHYDSPSDPKKIVFCPAACNAVQADGKAKIQIVLGCGTIPA